jgi:hypothetical protein
MKKSLIVVFATIALNSLSAMDWGEYESLCYANGKEPTYEEYENLCTVGATDYGYDYDDTLELFNQSDEE